MKSGHDARRHRSTTWNIAINGVLAVIIGLAILIATTSIGIFFQPVDASWLEHKYTNTHSTTQLPQEQQLHRNTTQQQQQQQQQQRASSSSSTTSHRRKLSTYPVDVTPDDGSRMEGEQNRDDWRKGCEIGCSFAAVVIDDVIPENENEEEASNNQTNTFNNETTTTSSCPKHGQLLFEMNYENVPPLGSELDINEECKEPCTICHHDTCEAEVLLGGEWFSCCAMWHTCTEEQYEQLAKLEDPSSEEENEEGLGSTMGISIILVVLVLGILGITSCVLMESKSPEAAAAPNKKKKTMQTVANVHEPQHMVVFNRIPGNMGCDATVETPPFDTWFSSRGVTETDFDVMMEAVVQPVNSFAKHLCGYICISMTSCGMCGWCCQVGEAVAIPKKIQEALDAFHQKYPNIKGSIAQSPPGIVFTHVGPPLSADMQSTTTTAVVASPLAPPPPDSMVVDGYDATPLVAVNVEAVDDTTLKLRKLKSLLDEGLITQIDYDTKKAEILAADDFL